MYSLEVTLRLDDRLGGLFHEMLLLLPRPPLRSLSATTASDLDEPRGVLKGSS